MEGAFFYKENFPTKLKRIIHSVIFIEKDFIPEA